MNSLERFNASMARSTFDRIPYSMNMVPELWEKICSHIGNRELSQLELLGGDCAWAIPRYTGENVKIFPDGRYTNMFGVLMEDVSFGAGSYSEAVGHPLSDATTVAEIEQYQWPSLEDFDYSIVVDSLVNNPDYAYTVGYLALGWYCWDLRGMDQFLEDLILDPIMANALIEQISDFGYGYFKRIIEVGKSYIGRNFRCIQLADDWATQEGLMISPEMYREYFKPHYKRIIDLAHEARLLVEFHICGSAVNLIPELIDTGIDILNPIQTSAKGMIPEQLQQRFGGQVAFSGGLDVQTIMPFGTTEEVRKEVFRLLDVFGKNGGYILQPSHSLQIDTPLENIHAMIKAIYEYYSMEHDVPPLIPLLDLSK